MKAHYQMLTPYIVCLAALLLIPSGVVADDAATPQSTPNAAAGKEILQNGDFSQGSDHWQLEQINPAVGSLEITKDGPNGSNCAKVTLQQAADTHWKMSLLQKDLHVLAAKSYRVTFMAKASEERWVYVGFKQHMEPYKALGGKNDIHIGTDWTQVSLVITPSADETNTRFSVGNLGQILGTLWFANFSVTEIDN